MKRLKRRTFLRGALGVAVGLPVLECMLDGNGALPGAKSSRGFARAANNGLPQRYAIVFAGQALGADGTQRDQVRINDVTTHEESHFIVPGTTDANGNFTVDTSGALTNADGSVPTPLLPLQADGTLSDITMVSGMQIPWVRGATFAPDGSDVPPGGAFRDFHGGGSSPLLSGVRSRDSSFVSQGPTSDQLVAALNAGQTNIPSLVFRCQPSFYLSGFDFSGREFISYSAAGSGGRIAAQTNYQTAWNSLFATFVPSDAAAAAIQDYTQRKRISVLDLVNAKRQALLGKVGAADKVRLGQHFDQLRDLEVRIKAIPPPATGQCQALTDPGAPPAVGGDNNGEGFDPADPNNQIAQNTGYSGEGQRAQVFADLIHMAFVCDLTRAATLQITAFQSHMNCQGVLPTVQQLISRPDVLIRADIHENGHNGDPDNKGQLHVSGMLAWHLSFYSYLLKKLKATPEGAGNVLDNTCVVFMPEAGHGTQLNDDTSPFATHSVDDMVLLVGGRAGGLVPGRHLPTAGAVHPAQVLLSAMQAVGYAQDTFGEVSGHFAGVFG
jgi:hypothetical protein